jgi:hypothetical protein
MGGKNNMTIEQIKEILKKRNYRKLLHNKESLLFAFVPNARDFNEAVFMLKNNIDQIPQCAYNSCQNRVPFRHYASGNQFYPKGCCEDHTKRINNVEKHGVENVSQLENIKEKKKETTFKNHGVSNPKQNKNIAQKIKNTMQTKYGGFGLGGNLKEKIESACVEKFGVANPMHSVHHKIKLQKTLYDKIVDRLSNFVKPKFTFAEYLGSHAKQEWQCVVCCTVFEGKIDNGAVPRCPHCYPNQKMSYGEMDLFNALDVIDKIQGDWSILKTHELDIYIPSKKIAIEFNGIYWHSERNGKHKDYHLNKTEACEKKGIQLIHVFESEWYFQKEILQSLINAKLGIFEKRIYARNCNIEQISKKEKNIFLEKNHLQGNDKSSIHIGLFYNNALVAVMTFGNSRYNKKYEYEMHRFCTKIGHQIIGGASKLWSYFVKHHDPNSVITYADRRYSDGTFYEKIGFEKIQTSKPNYFIIANGKLQSRLNWQKHLLIKKLKNNYDKNLTEWENIQLSGYDRIWDCGNYVFGWKK